MTNIHSIIINELTQSPKSTEQIVSNTSLSALDIEQAIDEMGDMVNESSGTWSLVAEKPHWATSSLTNIRNRLLDLTGRNRLLNFRHPQKSSIRIIDEMPNQIASELISGKSFKFKAVPEPTIKQLIKAGYIGFNEDNEQIKLKPEPNAKTWAAEIGLDTAYELPASSSTGTKHSDTDIQTLFYPRELEARLRNINSKYRTALEEAGVNLLYLAIGFLEWFESEHSEQKRLAPLFMLPVKITKDTLDTVSKTYHYNIEYSGEDIIANLSLSEKLRHDFDLALPSLEDDMLPETYLGLVQDAIIHNKPEWSVKRFASFAMFDFSKLLMYLDLDPSRWPHDKNIKDHAIVQDFFSSPSNDADQSDEHLRIMEEHAIDDLRREHEDYPIINKADSSQHSALIDALNGKNLVIEGPPGTGKSQTITNLISGAMATGKTVLFIAEKMAALEVVYSNLQDAGLSDFCLQLHSHKTQKKAFYDDLKKRIDLMYGIEYPKDIIDDIKRYKEKKKTLTQYAQLINKIFKSSGMTIHEILAAATRYRLKTSDVDPHVVRSLSWNVDDFKASKHQSLLELLERYHANLVEIKQQYNCLAEHPWFGITKTEITLDTAPYVDALAQWQQALCDIRDLVAPINTNNNLSILDIQDFIVDFRQLTINDSVPYHANALASMDNNSFEASQVAISALNDIHSILESIDGQVSSDLLTDRVAFTEIETAAKSLSKITINTETKLSELFLVSNHVSDAIESANALKEVIIDKNDFDHHYATYLPLTYDSVNSLRTYAQSIISLPAHLVSLRCKKLENNQIDVEIDKLYDVLNPMKRLEAELDVHFNLEQLPDLATTSDIVDLIRGGGVFSWLNPNWYRARSLLKRMAKGLSPQISRLKPLLGDLAVYSKLKQRFKTINIDESLLGDLYKGIDTDVEGLKILRGWYQSLEGAFGIGFSKSASNANTLKSLSNEQFEALREHTIQQVMPLTDQLINSMKSVSQQVKLPDIGDTSFEGLKSFRSLFDSIQKALKSLQPVFDSDPSINDITKVLFDGVMRYHHLKDTLIDCDVHHTFGYQLDGTHLLSPDKLQTIQSTIDLYESLTAIRHIDIRRFLQSDLNFTSIKKLAETTKDSLLNVQSYERSFKSIGRVNMDKWCGTGCNLDALIERNNKALQYQTTLVAYLQYIHYRNDLEINHLGGLADQAEQGAISPEQLGLIYQRVTFQQLAKLIFQMHPELLKHNGISQNVLRKQFSDLDEKIELLQKQKIAWTIDKIGQTRKSPGIGKGKVSQYTEMALLKHEASKKTRYRSLRQLLKAAPKSLLALKPCFMMSPHSAAQYLQPGQIEFDIIAMDEASQIKPEDALGCIARGKQVVIVGDPKQLSPTSFFQKSVEVIDQDESYAIEESESILDVAIPLFNKRRLRWHYRSQHEELIAFSNKEFYNNNLVVFPSPESSSDDFGVKFHFIPNGRFVNQRNIEEAKAIAAAVKNHVMSGSNESFGVVAMSMMQREQIERCIEEDTKVDSVYESTFSNLKTKQPFFVKNLENVQGDERDVIFISCTYGPKESGSDTMPQRFGPISNPGGERRLNVLFTRSKKRMLVFSSMREGHIRTSHQSSQGVKAFKAFLHFAEQKNLEEAIETGKEPDSDFEIAVIDALNREGFPCRPQVGVAGYFIDIGVIDPNCPGRYLMGIECDGATYHSAKSARDRDRLRQGVLEGLGWEIRRIWSTDWFKSPLDILKPIIDELHQMKSPEPVKTPEPVAETPVIDKDITERIPSDIHRALKELKTTIDKECALVPKGRHILREGMIEAFLEFRPTTPYEFLDMIPLYLRDDIHPLHGQYLDRILTIIAMYEEELST